MESRFARIVLIIALILFGLYIAQPEIDRLFFSATTPRTVVPRANLSDLERSTIELFERDSPSVVQSLARRQTMISPFFALNRRGICRRPCRSAVPMISRSDNWFLLSAIRSGSISR